MKHASTLRAHLVTTRLSGAIATRREKSLLRYRQFAARDPGVLLGLEPERDWRLPDVLALMAAECGVSGDPTRMTGPDTIDPDRTISALEAFADRLAVAARCRVPVLLGTGHPDRLLGFYAALAASLARVGCPVLEPAQGRCVDITTRFGVRTHRLSYVRGVALVHEKGARRQSDAPGVHTHSPLPLRTALTAAAAAGGPVPELVIGDHGWVCAAGQLGIEAMGPADADDPALFVGQAEGRVSVVVPVDDAVCPVHYGPLARYVLSRADMPFGFPE
nr:phosphatase [Streptomyces oceani]